MTDPGVAYHDADGRTRLWLVAVAASIGVAAALIFVGWPDLDLAASRLFNLGPRHFLFNDSDLASALRLGFRLLTWMASITAVSGIVLALAKRRRLLELGLAQWIFLALVLITGPGLIANTVLKDHWARPRPAQIVEFGGSDRFTPVLERSGQCARNCSFISGEASSTFALGFAIAMLARRRRAALMGAALAAGGITGLIRIGEGGHFLSDVIFAGVFMTLDVALMHWLVFYLFAPRVESEAWWHARTMAAAADIRRETAAAFARSADWLRQNRPSALANIFAAKDRSQGGKTDPDDPPA
ncbi:MAG: phosphatase PAP2 family protein [Methyloceanibacter sp.]